MTISEICQVLTAFAAVGGFGVSIWNSRRIKEVHDLTNSKMTELVTEVRAGSLAKGHAEGRTEAKAEDGIKEGG